MIGIVVANISLTQPCKGLVSLQHRSDEERERDGTVALTAGAIGRGAAVPLPYIGGSLSRNVRNADELAYQIAATVAFGLVQVRHGSALLRHVRGDRPSTVLLSTTKHYLWLLSPLCEPICHPSKIHITLASMALPTLIQRQPKL